MEKILFAALALFVVGIVALVYLEIRTDNAFADVCYAKNGMVIRTEDRLHCIRKDAFIEVRK